MSCWFLYSTKTSELDYKPLVAIIPDNSMLKHIIMIRASLIDFELFYDLIITRHYVTFGWLWLCSMCLFLKLMAIVASVVAKY